MKKNNRRDSISAAAKTAVSGLVAGQAPLAFARRRPVVRVLGTHVTLREEIRQQALKDLNIELVFEPKGSAAVLQKAASDPASFDLYEQWSDSINILWQAKAIQPIEIERLRYWSEINAITKTGKVAPEASLGAGDAPYKLLYVLSMRTNVFNSNSTLI